MFRAAAMTARMFRMDPVVVIKSDMFDFTIRTEAAAFVAEEEDKAAKAAKK